MGSFVVKMLLVDFRNRIFLLPFKTTILIIISLLVIGNVFESAAGQKNLQLASTVNSHLILRDINTVPSSIYVNNTFSIVATLMNNSSKTLMISNNGCKGEPLSASFDKSVNVTQGSPFCNLLITPFFSMKPNTSKTITTGNKNDASSDHYKAMLPGIITSLLKVEFKSKNDNRDNKEFASCIYHKTPRSPCIFEFQILTR
jgi:hypothetical protein